MFLEMEEEVEDDCNDGIDARIDNDDTRLSNDSICPSLLISYNFVSLGIQYKLGTPIIWNQIGVLHKTRLLRLNLVSDLITNKKKNNNNVL